MCTVFGLSGAGVENPSPFWTLVLQASLLAARAQAGQELRCNSVSSSSPLYGLVPVADRILRVRLCLAPPQTRFRTYGAVCVSSSLRAPL
jgi:hypothetical protein